MDFKSVLLFQACVTGDADSVELIINAETDLNCKDKDGKTPLMLASQHSQLHIVKLLVENNADIHQINTYRNNALFYAIDADDLDIASYLLNLKINPNHRNNGGFTPLFWAKSSEMMHLLIDFGADVNIQNNNGTTAIFEALFKELFYKNKSLVETLINRGANLDVMNKKDQTPVSYLMSLQKSDCPQRLEAGFDIEARKRKILKTIAQYGNHSFEKDL